MILSNNIDILFQTETHISAPPSIRDDISPPEYGSIHLPRIARKKKDGGRIAVIHKNT